MRPKLPRALVLICALVVFAFLALIPPVLFHWVPLQLGRFPSF
jgi:hypothetical protein